MINNTYIKSDDGSVVCNDDFEKYKARRKSIQQNKSLEAMVRSMQQQLNRLEKKIDQLITE